MYDSTEIVEYYHKMIGFVERVYKKRATGLKRERFTLVEFVRDKLAESTRAGRIVCYVNFFEISPHMIAMLCTDFAEPDPLDSAWKKAYWKGLVTTTIDEMMSALQCPQQLITCVKPSSHVKICARRLPDRAFEGCMARCIQKLELDLRTLNDFNQARVFEPLEALRVLTISANDITLGAAVLGDLKALQALELRVDTKLTILNGTFSGLNVMKLCISSTQKGACQYKVIFTRFVCF